MLHLNKLKSILDIFLLFLFVFITFTSSMAFANNPGQLDPNKIKFVSYMMASPKGSGQSSFGHSYLLFKSDEYASPGDLAIEFVAAVNPSEINYLRGLGLFPYDRKVVLEKLNVVKKDITIMQNRDLIIYDLNLSDSQRENIISKINQILTTGKMGQYSFLSSNCADAVSSVLGDIGVNVTGLTAKIPTHLKDKLEDKGLITKTTTFESIENLRLNAVKKYAANLNSIPLPKYYRKLDNMFEGADENQQLFNLLMAKQNMKTSAQPNQVDAFVNSYWLTLTALMKKQFKNMTALPVGSVRLNIKATGHSFSYYKVRSSKIECTYSDCALNVTYSRNDEPKDYLSSKFPLKSLTVKGDEIYLDKLLIGVRLGAKTLFSKESTISFAATPIVTTYYDDGMYIADIGFIIEKNLGISYQKKNIAWNKEVIWQTNTDPKYPMCFTILHLQQAMLEQAIFAPNLPKVSKKENIEIIKGLLNGRIAVIPGFENAYEFTKSIEHAQFINEIYPIHQQKYTGLLNGMGQWFQMETLTPETLKAMEALTHNLNISVPVVFRRNNSTRETISHAILITDMRDEGDHYSLSGYDPNFTHTDSFGTLNKKTLLMKTKTYGAVNLYLDKSNLDRSLINLQFINSPDVQELLIKQANRLKTYTFAAQEVLSMQ